MTATTTAPRSLDSKRLSSFGRTHGVYIVLGALILFNLIATPNFASLRNLQLQMVQVSPVVIVALGMAIVIGTEGIDLSVGAVMALAAAMVAVFIDQGPWVAILMALVAGVVAGLLNGALVAFLGIQPIIATLGLFVAGRGIALAFTSGRLVEIFDPTLSALAQQRLWGIPLPAVVAAGLALVSSVLVRRTRFGRHVVAIGGNTRAALSAGLPVRPVLLVVYVICGVFAALAGVLVTARSAAADPSFVGLLVELSAITAVVVGGTPLSGGRVRILGTVAGALLMQLVFSTLIRHDLSDSDARMVQAAIIVGAIYLQRERRSA
ncbi:MAG TPA: ABC transporter permease [Acidimicrobiia bacterium]|nr:ABC transporter permease [Acidimicrobiia bacterium]